MSHCFLTYYILLIHPIHICLTHQWGDAPYTLPPQKYIYIYNTISSCECIPSERSLAFAMDSRTASCCETNLWPPKQTGAAWGSSALQTDIALRSWVPLLERSSRSFGRLVGLEVAYPPIAKGLSLQVVPTLNHLQIFGSVLFLIVVAFNLIMLKQYIVYHI